MEPTIVHASKSQSDLLETLRRVATTDAEILISGPSGVGKELYAAYAHVASRRRDRPFVAVNCANFSEEMFENEIFGHAKGAFTGALAHSTGIAAAANGGTLFLDEVDALSMQCQAKLLRFAQLREYRRLGETFVRRADIRLIAASNADLPEKVRTGTFREDLYFRLRVVPIDVPPLADRPDDIPVLLDHFVGKYAAEYGVSLVEFTNAARRRLCDYPWPGNVRELENCVRYLTCLGLERPADCDDLQLLSLDAPPGDATVELNGEADLADIPMKEAKSMIVEDFERIYIDNALQRTHGNVSEAARHSGKHRRAFFELMRRYGIKAGNYRH